MYRFSHGEVNRGALLCQWAHARVRHPAGDRVRAAALVTGVIAKGAVMAGAGIAAGGACGYALAGLVSKYFQDMRLPDALPVAASALVLPAAAIVASVLPAARAARIDVVQALRSD